MTREEMRNIKVFIILIFVFMMVIVIIVIKTMVEGENTHPKIRSHKHLSRDYILYEDDTDTVTEIHSNNRSAPEVQPNTINVFEQTKVYGIFKPDQILVSFKTHNGKTPIYIHPSSKDIVSSYIKDHGVWEEDLLNQTGHYLLRHPDTVFIDIGCNIGVYTLFVAKLGVRVIAIDPIETNLRLLTMSLKENRLQDKVNLILNAVSHEYTSVLVDVPTDNIGGAHVVGKALSVAETKTRLAIKTILLDDLIKFVKGKSVFLKMDVEGHELKILQGGSAFFHTNNVKGILMEWVHHKNTEHAPKIIDSFIKRGYLPYENIVKETKLDPVSFYFWPENVFWLKR